MTRAENVCLHSSRAFVQTRPISPGVLCDISGLQVEHPDDVFELLVATDVIYITDAAMKPRYTNATMQILFGAKE